MTPIRSVCVYCGSSPGRSSIHVAAGETLGRALAGAGLRLVYGGGTKGIMGAVARGTLAAGGDVTGIIPRFLMRKEASEEDLVELEDLIVTDDMHQRKHAMFEKSDAFVALPGGIGTVEEIVEVMTWAQLGRHRKPILLANIDGFWDPMIAMLEHMKSEGFLHSSHLIQPLVVDTAEAIMPALLAASAAAGDGTDGDRTIIGKL